MAFITESVPQSFIDGFDAHRLRGEVEITSWPRSLLRQWTIDKELGAALISVADNGMTRRTVDDTLPRRTWYALFWHDRVISFETTTGANDAGGVDPKTGRDYQIDVWDDTDIWLDDDLIDKLPKILELTKEAYYVSFDGPDLPFVKGVEIHVRSINDQSTGGAA